MRKCTIGPVVTLLAITSTAQCTQTLTISRELLDRNRRLVVSVCESTLKTVCSNRAKRLMKLRPIRTTVEGCMLHKKLSPFFASDAVEPEIKMEVIETLFLLIDGEINTDDTGDTVRLETLEEKVKLANKDFGKLMAENNDLFEKLGRTFRPEGDLKLIDLDFVRFPLTAINIICTALKPFSLTIRGCTGVKLNDIEQLDIPSLSGLDLIGLRLNELPCLKGLPNLTTLDISQNHIERFGFDRYLVGAAGARGGDAAGTSATEPTYYTMPKLEAIILRRNRKIFVDFKLRGWLHVLTSEKTKYLLTMGGIIRFPPVEAASAADDRVIHSNKRGMPFDADQETIEESAKRLKVEDVESV